MIDGCYTVSEAAALSGYTEGYIRRLISEGKLPSRKVGVRMNIIPSEEMKKFMRSERTVGRPRKKTAAC